MNNFKFKLLAAVCVPAILLIVLTVLTLYALSPRFLAGYSGGQKQLLMLHMDGCPHCVTLMPEWDKFARMNSNTGVTARKVEACPIDHTNVETGSGQRHWHVQWRLQSHLWSRPRHRVARSSAYTL